MREGIQTKTISLPCDTLQVGISTPFFPPERDIYTSLDQKVDDDDDFLFLVLPS